MKRILATLFLMTATGSAMADSRVPVPPPRPYDLVANRDNIMTQRKFRIVMPNGHVRQCVVTNRFQQGRGMVHTRSCWRVR